MASLGSAGGLADEIESCGKLRNDIGNALKFNAQRAAKYGLFHHEAAAYVFFYTSSKIEYRRKLTNIKQ